MYDCGLEKKDTTQNIPKSPGTKSVGFWKIYGPSSITSVKLIPPVTIQRSQ